MTDKPLGQQNYEQFADRYAQSAPTKPHNAYYERPSTLSLLPDVKGKRVLDAGCGPGIYAEWLLEHGAQVVAVDVTPAFVIITRQRVGDRATVLQADLAQPLSFAEDASFDVVVSPLVLDYIRDWGAVFGEFHRVLKAGGVLVFSCGHPIADMEYSPSKDYFALEMVAMEWRGFGEPHPVVRSYRRSLQDIFNPLVGAGLRLDKLVEPQPTPDYAAVDPDGYAELMRQPGFLCVRAVKG